MDNELLNKVVYNTSNLSIAEFTYEYNFSYYDSVGENNVSVQGQRTGIIHPYGDKYIDLVSEMIFDKENIISEKKFIDENSNMFLHSVLTIFKSLEKAYDYSAVETRGKRTLRVGTLFGCIPYQVTFKPSEAKRGMVDEFVKNARIMDMDTEPKCEIDRMIGKVKQKLRRKR